MFRSAWKGCPPSFQPRNEVRELKVATGVAIFLNQNTLSHNEYGREDPVYSLVDVLQTQAFAKDQIEDTREHGTPQ